MEKNINHLLSLEIGYPFDSEIADVTIISVASIDGNALSTDVFLFWSWQGSDYVNNPGKIEAVFIKKIENSISQMELLENLYFPKVIAL